MAPRDVAGSRNRPKNEVDYPSKSRSGYGQAPDVGIDFDNLRGEEEFDSGEAYGRSKLANALFSLELSKRLQDSEAT